MVNLDCHIPTRRIFVYKKLIFTSQIFQIALESVTGHEHAFPEHDVVAGKAVSRPCRSLAEQGVLAVEAVKHLEPATALRLGMKCKTLITFTTYGL